MPGPKTNFESDCLGCLLALTGGFLAAQPTLELSGSATLLENPCHGCSANCGKRKVLHSTTATAEAACAVLMTHRALLVCTKLLASAEWAASPLHQAYLEGMLTVRTSELLLAAVVSADIARALRHVERLALCYRERDALLRTRIALVVVAQPLASAERARLAVRHVV